MVRSFNNLIRRKKSYADTEQGVEGCVSEKAKAVLHLLRRKGPPLTVKQLDYCNDACIERVLKAKGNNPNKAAKQLRATLSWRASLDIDYLTADEFSAELAWGSAYVAGQDEEGRPVLVVKLKPESVSGQAQKQFMRYFVFTMEVAIACMSPSVEQCILILDAAACQKRRSPGFSTVVQLLKVLGEHYPERLARCFIVDAPAMFHLLWKGISQVLDLKVREKPRFVFSKKYNCTGTQKRSSSASVAANHLIRAAGSFSSRNLWAGDEDHLSDAEEDVRDKFSLRTPSMPRRTRTAARMAASCNSPPAVSTFLSSVSSLSPSSVSPSSASSSSLSSFSTAFSPSSTSLPSASLCIPAALSSSSVTSSMSASSSSSLTTSSAASSSSSSSSTCSSSWSSSTSALCSHSTNGAALLSDKVHARSLSFASVPTCRKEAVSEFRSFRADSKLSRRLNEDGASRRWADLTFNPKNDELPPHLHQHVDYACKHNSDTLFRPYYTNFLTPPYNEATYRGHMKPPLAGLISIISPDLKYRQPSFSLHSTAMEAMLQHLHFD